jgi:hypothetical protein
MGIFDRVNFRMNCPRCGTLVEDFQTKDGDVCLSTVEPEDVLTFYSSCNKCDQWIELTRLPEASPVRSTREVPLTLDEVLALGFRLTDKRVR